MTIGPLRNVPDGIVTVPPPAVWAALSAIWIAEVLSVLPSPLAPKVVMSNEPAGIVGSGTVAGLLGPQGSLLPPAPLVRSRRPSPVTPPVPRPPARCLTVPPSRGRHAAGAAGVPPVAPDATARRRAAGSRRARRAVAARAGRGPACPASLGPPLPPTDDGPPFPPAPPVSELPSFEPVAHPTLTVTSPAKTMFAIFIWIAIIMNVARLRIDHEK